MKIGTLLAILVCVIIAVAHVFRLIFGVEITANGWLVPQWMSLFAVIMFGLIALQLWRESR